MRVSLQTKIVTLFTAIILFVTCMLTGMYIYIGSKSTEENMGKLALRVATTVSLIPAIRNAFELDYPSRIIQPLTEEIRTLVGAEFIVVGNKDSIRYSHPDMNKIGKKMVGGDNNWALLKGEYYTSKAIGSLGPSLRGKAPILNDQGEIIGIVSVGFMLEDIRALILRKVATLIALAVIILSFAIIGGILLAKNIRKDILGLEPHEIASLYRERNAILQSIKEGIISTDEAGKITMINQSAKDWLKLKDSAINQPISSILPSLEMDDVIKTKHFKQDEEMILQNRTFIVNQTPIVETDKIVGVVASFRDKTDIQNMLNTISEIRKYSEEMRAQTHEYTNKLYGISGFLQLGKYDDAIQMIQTDMKQNSQLNKLLFDQIKDRTVQAILLGKISHASEKKIHFVIDENSSLEPISPHIDHVHLITIIGNLIDNAFEAVMHQKEKHVSFFSTDLANDIIIEISDNGPGIPEQSIDLIFDIGFSTKKQVGRGYGLANAKAAINMLGGSIEIMTTNEGGVTFSVYIPKLRRC